jgi:hypothetical protein
LGITHAGGEPAKTKITHDTDRSFPITEILNQENRNRGNAIFEIEGLVF